MNSKKDLKPNFFEHPLLLIRFIYIIIYLARHGFFSLLIKFNLASSKAKYFFKFLVLTLEKKNRQTNLASALGNLGPGFVKFGQALSTRPDLLGLKITKNLIDLQDNLNPFAFDKISEIIENETGKKLKEIFSKFNSEPVAAASISQVHRATLMTGEKVVVKVLRPDIEKSLNRDFKLFLWVSHLVNFFSPAYRRFKLPEMVLLFAKTSVNEIDLRLEAASCCELAENFKNFKKFMVPKVFWDFTSKKILTLSYMDGTRIDQIVKKKNHKTSTQKLTKLASEIFFLQVFRDGFFHADLHPGNILVDKTGNIIALDFGIMGRLSHKDRKFLSSLIINLLEKKFDKVTKLHFDYGLVEKSVNEDQLTQEIIAISLPIIDKPIGQISLANLLGAIIELSKKFDIKIQPQFTLLQKTMVMAEGVARQIDPNTNIWQITKPLFHKWARENVDINTFVRNLIDENQNNFGFIIKLIGNLIENIEKVLKK